VAAIAFAETCSSAEGFTDGAAAALIGLIAIALVLGARDLSSYARHLMLP
jgi:hypothetical protein